MLSRFRKILGRFAIVLATALGGILVFDHLAARCPLESAISDKIIGINAENLENHVRKLSAIGSRFRVVKKGPGIRGDPGEPFAEINRNLKPIGMAIMTGREQGLKLEYLEKELLKMDLIPQRIPFETKKLGTGINLIAMIEGRTDPEEIIDVTAHYDSYASSPGADDNSSGVAGVLEIARVIKSQQNMARSIRFVFFDLEELGLIGSRAYIAEVKKGKLLRPSACLNLEMIGYFSDLPDTQRSPARIPFLFEPPTVGNTIVTVGNFHSYWQGRRLDGIFAGYVPELPVFSVSRWGGLMGNASRSDHFSYWEAGIPAVMLTDSANFRNPNYHKPSDLPETLDFSRMKLVAQGAAAFVLDWAKKK